MALDHYVTLGRSGLRVSPLCLGAMTFGEDLGWGSTVEESQRIMDGFIAAGGNFIDTANFYTKSHSEKIIGDHLGRHPAKRDRLVIATKFSGNLYPGDPNGGGSGRKSVINACEHSLRRLQTDYIDLYWLHNWDVHTPIDETMAALEDLVRSGSREFAGTFLNEKAYALVDELGIIAKAHDSTVARVALAWVRTQPGVSSTIIGARRLSQLEDNLKSLDLVLTATELAHLDALTKPAFGFPQNMQPLFPAIHHGGTTVNGVYAPPTSFGVEKTDKLYCRQTVPREYCGPSPRDFDRKRGLFMPASGIERLAKSPGETWP